jgi:FAD synthetase
MQRVIKKRVVSREKVEPKPVRIMVFGTFDIVHPGHLHFFKQARALAKNPYLVVSIARDINVQRIKGRLPLHNERQRAALVKYSGSADKVVLGDVKGYIRHIIRARPDIIALGYDQQSSYVNSLQEAMIDQGLDIRVLRLKSHKPERFKTSKLII